MPRETPAQKAMDFYVQPGRRRPGRPRACLPTVLDEDMRAASCGRFRRMTDLEVLRGYAADRDAWRDLVNADLTEQ